ncbi:MAG: TerB family tellurite resistance protein [Phycisphaerae bacterium]|nr:TerB family tellurite resistance protein [Phycisphaerae bacterium]
MNPPRCANRTPDPRVEWFADASEEQKRAVVHALLAVAASDGTLVTPEKTVIAEACGRLGVSSLDVATALASPIPESVEAPRDRRARTALMLDAAAVMVADHRIDDRELAVLLMVGKSLGFSTAEIGDLAAQVAGALVSSQRREVIIDRMLGDGHTS